MNHYERDVPLRDYTTLKVGGPAEFFVTVTSEEELIEVLRVAHSEGMPLRVIGGGSNVLAPDQGLSGVTVRNMIPGWQEVVTDTGVLVTVGAGEVLDRVVEYAVSKEYWGLENLSHIPGSVGATPIQNVGAYGVEIGDLITEVRVVNRETLEIETLNADSCAFGYRDSIFKKPEGKKYVVTSVTYALHTHPSPMLEYKDLKNYFADIENPAVADIRAAVIEIRSQKFPDWRRIGTAGSFFKNPIVRRVTYEKLRAEYPGIPGFDVSDRDVKIPLGWILDNVCHVRGIQKGNVGTYAGQALVLVANENATANEITDFAHFIADTVFEKTGITIEWEVTKLK